MSLSAASATRSPGEISLGGIGSAEELAASETLAEAIPQQVWTATPEGELDFVNRRVTDYFGASAQQVLGAGWQAVIHPEDLPGCIERWTQSVATGEQYEVEFRLRRFDGAYRWHLGRALAVRDNNGRVTKWFGTNTDIDDAKKTREELKKRTEFEQHLVGIVSHDLRNPLNAILLGASALGRYENLDARAAKNVLRIQSSAHRASRMICDLLDFTQSRLGDGIPVHPRSLDVGELMEQVVEEVRASYPEREIRVSQEVQGVAEWDADRLAQVMTNLLINALNYSAPGSPVSFSARGAVNSVTFDIHNRGEPIPATVIPTLFQPMKRGVTGTERSTRSIGLGLYIVREIVGRHGGTVDVRSTNAEGTTFTVVLPRHSSK